MKNFKKLALALVFSCATMGAGYAYWSDQVTVNNTVSTGEFKVVFVDDQYYPKIFGVTGENYITKSIVQDDEKTTTVTVGNMYPGGYVRYEAKIKNDGTIPVVFDNAVVNFDSSTTAGITDKMNAQFGIYKHHADGTAYTGAEAGGITGYFPLKNLQAQMNSMLDKVRLEPGEFITFDIPKEYYDQMKIIDPNFVPSDEGNCMSFVLPTTVGDTNKDELEKATAKFSIQVNWKQHNK